MDRIRKFDFEDGKVVMKLDCSGEFIHKNDIMFLLYEKKRELENMMGYTIKEDEASEWDKKYQYGLNEQIKLIDHLINKI